MFNNDLLVNQMCLAWPEIECEYTAQACSGLPSIPLQ